MLIANKILQRLKGQWTLTRQFSGKTNGFCSATGTANFTESDENLTYEEHVEITTDTGQRVTAHRAYVYKILDDKITVFFDEEPLRLFHTLTPGSVNGKSKNAHIFTGIHHCHPDTYQVSYIFLDNLNAFKINYTVTGPKKNYSSNTEFTKVLSNPSSTRL